MAPDDLRREGRARALGLLARCSTGHGFAASAAERNGQRRILARDGVLAGLAVLAWGEGELIRSFRRTLLTLALHQGPHGEIPESIDPATGRVSYGGAVGRVDPALWFLIGVVQYWRATKDRAFLELLAPVIDRVGWLLGAWELNNRGLLYVPPCGDWAHDCVRSGYVLSDQVLYLRAQRELISARRALTGCEDPERVQRAAVLRRLIRGSYWLGTAAPEDGEPYHEALQRKASRAAVHCAGRYWLACFSPQGAGYRFDALANVLVSLTGVADPAQTQRVDRYIADQALAPGQALLPAFHPVVPPRDEDWTHLQTTFAHVFRNQPFEYHNWGLWPMLTGLYAADLALRGERDRALRLTRAVHAANRLGDGGEAWCFPQYVDGCRGTPGGPALMAWSAGAALLAEAALDGRPVLLDGDG
jgi:hypothetical protein